MITAGGMGGNVLMNVGPTKEGIIPEDSAERLRQIGVWLKTNGESIYDSTAGPFTWLPWGTATRKGDIVYLQVFQWPSDGVLNVPLANKPVKAWLLADPSKATLTVDQKGDRLLIHLPKTPSDPVASVVALQVEGEPLNTFTSLCLNKPVTASCSQNSAKSINDDSSSLWGNTNGTASFTIDLGKPETFTTLRIGLYSKEVKSGLLEVRNDGSWKTILKDMALKRDENIVTFPPATGDAVRLSFSGETNPPQISSFELYPALGGVAATASMHDADPLIPCLDGKAPEILREVTNGINPPEGVSLRQVVFRSRDNSEIYAAIASPKAPGKYPGILVLHGGAGSAEVDKALAWAQRGYVAVAPDLPGIAEPKKLTETKGSFSSLKYGEGRWVANPDASESVIFDAVLSAMKSLYLLKAQPNVDTANIGVVGCSWGGYMTTMVCGLAGDQVKAGLALYGCGFFDLGCQSGTVSYDPKLPRTSLSRLSPDERARWLQCLDAGRRAPKMKASYFLAAASNDFFGWPRSAQATLDAIPGEKNHLFAPNANHKVPVPGGSSYDINSSTNSTMVDKNFVPTAFQPLPTPKGQKGNWISMEVPYFDHYLKGIGQPFPKVTVEKTKNPTVARFSITAPHPITKAEVYWAKAAPTDLKADDVKKREWIALPAVKTNRNTYEAKLPQEAAEWFALVSDDRPVTVSGDMIVICRLSNRPTPP
jgi:dienelactone hydrolase